MKKHVDYGSVLDAHLGREGNNQLDVDLALERARMLIGLWDKGEIVIITSDRSPDAIKAKVADIEGGKCRLIRIQSFPDAKLGEKRQDGIAITTDDGKGGNIDRCETHWHLA